jgi:hypothetical protein
MQKIREEEEGGNPRRPSAADADLTLLLVLVNASKESLRITCIA